LRLAIRRLSLVGTTREIEFDLGLNVVLGDFTTGKTPLMRALRVFLGTSYDGIIPEFSHVSDLAGRLEIGDETVSVVRRLVQSRDASVDIAAEGFSARLPVSSPKRPGMPTYNSWFLEKFGLPELRVPTAPSKPAESATSPVSVADYLRYCRLTQDQIAKDILGSSEWFKDYKRRIVFRIYFGGYDAKVAQLQEQLREVESRLRTNIQQTHAFDQFLEGTVLANRAELRHELEVAEARLTSSDERSTALASGGRKSPEAAQLGQAVLRLDAEIRDLEETERSETLALTQSGEIARQLRAQSGRLTQAVVASSHFVDYEFRVCPRCSQKVQPGRAEGEDCYLCMQQPGEQPTRADLLTEQIRVEQQIDETGELIEVHRAAAERAAAEIETTRGKRRESSAALDRLTATYVSEHAQEIAASAAERASAVSRIEQLETYSQLLAKADAARSSTQQLQLKRDGIEEQLERAEQTDRKAAERVDHLEARFAEAVEALEIPRFIEAAEPRAAIGHADFEPIVNGRRVDQLGGGMAVLVNVAYMIAIHRTAIELDLAIPGLLMIDGINQNLGRDEYDSRRYELIWRELIRLANDHTDRLQLIVATNDVPDFVEELDVVKVRLRPDDRLVPLPGGAESDGDIGETPAADPEA
jgi:hypothetical protein